MNGRRSSPYGTMKRRRTARHTVQVCILGQFQAYAAKGENVTFFHKSVVANMNEVPTSIDSTATEKKNI